MPLYSGVVWARASVCWPVEWGLWGSERLAAAQGARFSETVKGCAEHLLGV